MSRKNSITIFDSNVLLVPQCDENHDQRESGASERPKRKGKRVARK